MKKVLLVIALLALSACSESGDPRAAAGKWPPKDFPEFTGRPPMSVAAELDDEWSIAMDAERWSYRLGLAIVAVGGTPPPESGAPAEQFPERTTRALQIAATRLVALHALTCGARPVAKPQDCAAFVPPPWLQARATPSKDEMQARLLWLQEHAEQFSLPACDVAIKRTGDRFYCAAE